MYDEIIILIKKTGTQDSIGNQVPQVEKREVFAEKRSIGSAEFYQAAVSGLKPEAKFILADYMDYQNESMLEYRAYGETKAQKYTVIRTYQKGNELELMCRKKSGA